MVKPLFSTERNVVDAVFWHVWTLQYMFLCLCYHQSVKPSILWEFLQGAPTTDGHASKVLYQVLILLRCFNPVSVNL